MTSLTMLEIILAGLLFLALLVSTILIIKLRFNYQNYQQLFELQLDQKNHENQTLLSEVSFLQQELKQLRQQYLLLSNAATEPKTRLEQSNI